MRFVKHFYKVFIGAIKSLTCKHINFKVASCPFTGYTYTTCNDCMKRLQIKPTES
jgi:hypothetical protein